jgi:hypothetical protein
LKPLSEASFGSHKEDNMNISLSIDRPDVEVVAINIASKTVDFKDMDGLCNCPYVSEADIPTEKELQTAIEAVLGAV